jgi:two-component system, chemotaxis family, protein-glutamate methylesterase/glutaminase
MPSRELVAIGGSLGGLAAVREILVHLPGDYGLAVIVLLHQYRHGTGLPRMLATYSKLPLAAIDDKAEVARGKVHVCPANYHTLCERTRKFALSIEPPVNFSRPSIDVLFESVADVYGAQVVGVLLSGATSDGAAGLASIKAAGGFVLCQDPATAEQPTMPRAALKRTTVDWIGSPGAIGLKLSELGS